ncbi:preprotein translocase subunit YajC [[Clostridium] cellulosi]
MMYFENLVVGAAASASTSSAATNENTAAAMLVTFGPLILIFVLFYFFFIRPQRKKEKKVQEMRNSLQVGDNVTTVGGIIGRVVSIKEDSVVIETGADRNKIRIKKWAIQSVETIHDD